MIERIVVRERALSVQAALGPAPQNREAWERLQSECEGCAPLTRKLYPLIYLNLSKSAKIFSDESRLAEVYQREWLLGSKALLDSLRVVRDFQQSGVDVLALKGLGMLCGYYRDPAVRPMRDIDLLIRPEQLEDALELLQEWGWQSRERRSLSQVLQTHHAASFKGPDGLHLDLHIFSLYDCRWNGIDSDFWNRAVTHHYWKHSVPTLCPEDMLLHVCAHGMRSRASGSLWAIDALLLLREVEIDWDSFLQETSDRLLGVPICEALVSLKRDWRAPIPDRVLTEVQRFPSTFWDRAYYRYRGWPNLPWSLYLWFDFMRNERPGSVSEALSGYLLHMQKYWGVSRIELILGLIRNALKGPAKT